MATLIRCFRVFLLLGMSTGAIALAGASDIPDAGEKATVVDVNTHTYRFTARITANDGVLPFRVGSRLHGQFTYDMKAKDQRPNSPLLGFYPSTRNRFSFQLGDQHFTGTDVTVTTGALSYAEHFGINAYDLKLPPGWEIDHTKRSQSYGIILQNAPSRGVMPNKAVPDRLKLSDFKNTRELRLDFFHGVRFPGGQVKGRAIVCATVELLEAVPGCRN